MCHYYDTITCWVHSSKLSECHALRQNHQYTYKINHKKIIWDLHQLLRFRDLEGMEWFEHLARRVWFVAFPGRPPFWWRLEAVLCPPHQLVAEHSAQRNPWWSSSGQTSEEEEERRGGGVPTGKVVIEKRGGWLTMWGYLSGSGTLTSVSLIFRY